MYHNDWGIQEHASIIKVPVLCTRVHIFKTKTFTCIPCTYQWYMHALTRAFIVVNCSCSYLGRETTVYAFPFSLSLISQSLCFFVFNRNKIIFCLVDWIGLEKRGTTPYFFRLLHLNWMTVSRWFEVLTALLYQPLWLLLLIFKPPTSITTTYYSHKQFTRKEHKIGWMI